MQLVAPYVKRLQLGEPAQSFRQGRQIVVGEIEVLQAGQLVKDSTQATDAWISHMLAHQIAAEQVI